MESGQTHPKLYQVPFNILVCDVCKDSENNLKVLKYLLGEKFKKLTQKQLRNGDTSYINSQWEWLYTPTTIDQIIFILKYYLTQKDLKMNHTMLFLKTESITQNGQCTQTVSQLLDQFEELIPETQPMTMIITNNHQETEKEIREVIQYKIDKGERKRRRIDPLSFYILNSIDDKGKLLASITIHFYLICYAVTIIS